MGTPDLERVAFYARQASRYVVRAADCVEDDRQDEFLWHARRATEAVLLAVLASRGEPDPPAGETSLEKLRALLKELPQVPFDVRADLDAVRNNCNMGSHALLKAQSATASGSPVHFASKVRRHFPEVLKWARAQPVLDRMLDQRLDEWIFRIEGGTGRSRLQQALDERARALRESRHRFFKGVGIGLVSGLFFAALGAFVRSSMWRDQDQEPEPSRLARALSSPPTSVVEDVAAPTVPSTRLPIDTGVPVNFVYLPDVVEDLAAGDCPRETRWVRSTVIGELRPPPDRPYWPRERGNARVGTVRAYCIDRSRVQAQQYQECVQQGFCQWRGREERGTTPATHLWVQDAEAYCRWKGESFGLEGALPSIVEWEALARSMGSDTYETLDLASAQPLFEWTSDRAFPSLWAMSELRSERMTRERLVRQSGSEPRWSWNHTSEQQGAGTVAFRCRYRRSR